MKTNAIVRIIIWSLVILVLVGLMTASLGESVSFRNVSLSYPDREVERYRDDMEPSVSNTVSDGNAAAVKADQVRELSIEWVAGDITLLPVEGTDQIRFEEEAVDNEKYRMVYKLSGNDLKILFCKDSISFSSFGLDMDESFSKDLIIQVPADWICDTLELDVASANLKIHDLTIREVDFDGASGTCDFYNCQVRSLDMDTASGDVTFGGTLDILDFDAASASFTGVFENVPQSIDMDGMSGNLDITLPETAGFTASMAGMSSDFSSDFETTIYNGNYVSGDGRCRINMEGMSCDLYIRMHHADGHRAEECTDETCMDVSHNHPWLCTEAGCTDVSHNHEWNCADETCAQESHSHGSNHHG